MDIFIKTYHKDYIWLDFCLRSIKKFAHGFRDVVIVTEESHPIPQELLNIIPLKVYYVPFPSTQPKWVEHGLGYLWQQYIKLTWYNYTDASAVLIMDSDEMFTVPTSPFNFQSSGKYFWYYRDWKDAGTGICWKKWTDAMLCHESQYNAMCITGFVMEKETSIKLKEYLCKQHSVGDIWDIFVKHNMQTTSEFNVFGSFVHHHCSDKYIKKINFTPKETHNVTIRKTWSWGGVKDSEKEIRNKILT